MKLINTSSSSFPCPAGSNTILLPDGGVMQEVVPHDWNIKDVITVPDETHEMDFI